ncbi:MAG: ATP-binding cassette domain-containing protein, partial [Rhizobium sp.]
MSPIVKLANVHKAFGAVKVLNGVSFEVGRGEVAAVIGQSGSGKSTLMNILGCLDQPTSGDYRIDGEPVSDIDSD